MSNRKPLSNEQLAALRSAAQLKGAPLSGEERAKTLRLQYVAPSDSAPFEETDLANLK